MTVVGESAADGVGEAGGAAHRPVAPREGASAPGKTPRTVRLPGRSDAEAVGDARRSRPPSAWVRAGALAARTPEARNRYVDFLRAASIVIVVMGHWLMAAPSVERGEFTLSDMLHVAPWTQWLTWLFQVMPLFFIVGGYANAASWWAARSAGHGYRVWVARRLQRLVRPVLPVVVLWCLLAATGWALGLSGRAIEIASQVAFVPTWFLAVYVMVIVAAPATYELWVRYGMGSFWALVLGAVVVDAAWLASGADPLSWVNYACVWLALHQLGYAWRDGALAGPTRTLPLAIGGFATLALLVRFAGYPVSMVTVPGEEVSNASPPTLALLALGAAHAGLVLAMEPPARRWLERRWIWTATVLVNGVIMTLYLWHATVMVLLVGLAHWLGGAALAIPPDTPGWWATRPLWVLVLLGVLSGFVAVFGRFEARGLTGPADAPPAWRSVTGAIAVCTGLAALAIGGIAAPTVLGLRAWAVGLILLGAVVGGLVRVPRSSPA